MQILPTSRHICSEVSYKNLIIHQNILPISSVLSQFFSLFLFRWKVPIRIAPIKAFLNTYELNKIPQVCSLFSFVKLMLVFSSRVLCNLSHYPNSDFETNTTEIPRRRLVKGARSRFAHLETCSLSFSSSSFVIRVNLLHP